MICNKCGKEIPDGSAYCGYCGASQSLEVTETLEKIEEQQMIEDAQLADKPASENPEKGFSLPKIDLPKVDLPKVDLPQVKVDWSEFSQLWDILKDPFTSIKLKETPIVVIVIFAIISWWMAVGKLATSFLMGAIMFTAALLCEYLEEKAPRHFSTAINRSAQRIFVPSILMLIAGIVRLTMGAVSGDDALTILVQLSGLQIQLNIYLLLIIFAWAFMAVASARMTRRVNGYIVILVYAAAFVLAMFTLRENSTTILGAILSVL